MIIRFESVLWLAFASALGRHRLVFPLSRSWIDYCQKGAVMKPWLAFFIALYVSTYTVAATLLIEDGILMGADGVNVSGQIYDVRFMDGTCEGIFGDCNETADLFFHDEASAKAADLALVSQVLITFEGTDYGSLPWLINGCQRGQEGCDLLNPYEVDSVDQNTTWVFSSFVTVVFGAAPNANPLAQGWLTLSDYSLVNQSESSFDRTYTAWSNSTVISIPASAWLFLSAVGGLSTLKRTKSNRGN